MRSLKSWFCAAAPPTLTVDARQGGRRAGRRAQALDQHRGLVALGAVLGRHVDQHGVPVGRRRRLGDRGDAGQLLDRRAVLLDCRGVRRAIAAVGHHQHRAESARAGGLRRLLEADPRLVVLGQLAEGRGAPLQRQRRYRDDQQRGGREAGEQHRPAHDPRRPAVPERRPVVVRARRAQAGELAAHPAHAAAGLVDAGPERLDQRRAAASSRPAPRWRRRRSRRWPSSASSSSRSGTAPRAR